MLNRLRIGTRLAIGYGGLIVIAAAAFAGAVGLGNSSLQATERAATEARARVATTDRMRMLQLQAVSAIRSAGLETDSVPVNRETAVFRSAMKGIEAAEADLVKLGLTVEEKAVLDRASVLRREAAVLADEALKFALAWAGEEAAKVLNGKFSPLQAEWVKQLDALSESQQKRTGAATDAIAAESQRNALVLTGLLAVACLGSIGFAVVLTRSVTRPLNAAVAAASQVAAGDLTLPVEPTGNDETALLLRSLRTMAEQLSGMVREVRESSHSIACASDEISNGNTDLSERTERQAAALQETVAAMSALSDGVTQNSEHAQNVLRLADRTAQIAAQGGKSMGEVVETMSGISDSSRRIADIINVIDGIAFQTNILALNAAVEAARAGEQGRGFAVVASEVRALAHRVSTASKEVRQLIGESVGRVDSGAALVGAMGGTMKELVDGVAEVRSLVAGISTASQAQSSGIRQVNTTVTEIDDSTQQNAALVEQMAAASVSLSGQTQRLAALVDRFRLDREAVGA